MMDGQRNERHHHFISFLQRRKEENERDLRRAETSEVQSEQTTAPGDLNVTHEQINKLRCAIEEYQKAIEYLREDSVADGV
jgi:hypothetical protein